MARTFVTPRLGRAELDAFHYPAALCDALFAAVLIDDEVDADTRLPASIALDYRQAELVECFRLCRQLWASGFDRTVLRGLVASLIRHGDLEAGDRLKFKHMRAKFKHLRYATALYGAAHRYSPLLDRVTITMGQLQDAYRNGRRPAVVARAVQLRLALTRPFLSRLHAEADSLRPTTPSAFRAMLASDAGALQALIAHPTVTGHAFHRARKVVGRQVSFWDTLRTLRPSPDRYDMSRTLSAINGLMGALHDDLVERRASDRGSYGASFVLPDAIRARIAALTACYQAAIAAGER